MKKFLILRESDNEDDMNVDIAGPGVYHHTHHHHHHKKGDDDYVAVHHPVMESVHERIENPPTTWAAYAGHPNSAMAVIDMEHQELAYAKASGDPAAIIKELTDLAAACVHALKSM